MAVPNVSSKLFSRFSSRSTHSFSSRLTRQIARQITNQKLAWGALSILASGISWMVVIPYAGAQVNNADLACYLHSEQGVEFDLSALCGSGQPAGRPQEVVLQTGDVQVTLRWDTSDDLDLFVRGPSGDQVSYFNRSIPSGGELDVDANAGCGSAMAAPVENIFWPTGGGVPGDYMITVDLYSRCTGESGPINFTVDALVRGQVQTFTGSVSEGQSSVEFPFTFADNGAAPGAPQPLEGRALPTP